MLIPIGTNKNDIFMTPQYLADSIVRHYLPSGIILEPCRGSGNFIKAFEKYCRGISISWCEITEGKDFFDFNNNVDWIITNPPFSKMRKFIQHFMEISNNIVFLSTINHLWLRARLRDIENARFGIKEIMICDTPIEFPQSGFQIGTFYLQKNYLGKIGYSKYKY